MNPSTVNPAEIIIRTRGYVFSSECTSDQVYRLRLAVRTGRIEECNVSPGLFAFRYPAS